MVLEVAILNVRRGQGEAFEAAFRVGADRDPKDLVVAVEALSLGI